MGEGQREREREDMREDLKEAETIERLKIREERGLRHLR
jgi:hypothetical protein